MSTTETTTAPSFSAVRTFRGKRCVVQVTTPDGRSFELAGRRAETAAAAIVFELGQLANDDGRFYKSSAGWHVEGLRRCLYAAHSKAAAIQKPKAAGYYGRTVLEARVVVVKTAPAPA